MAHSDQTTTQEAKGGTLAGLIRLARPKDWVKNVFVLIPVPFALADKMQEDVAVDPATILLGLWGFCLVNSAIYTLNDLFDADVDARERPGRPPPAVDQARRSGAGGGGQHPPLAAASRPAQRLQLRRGR